MVKLVSETVKRKYMNACMRSLMPYKDMSNYYGFLAEKMEREREGHNASRADSKSASKSRAAVSRKLS
jgi:hypothetical protein